MFRSLETYDFQSLGCMDHKGCYVGAYVFHKKAKDFREKLSYTLELLTKARDKGSNTMELE